MLLVMPEPPVLSVFAEWRQPVAPAPVGQVMSLPTTRQPDDPPVGYLRGPFNETALSLPIIFIPAKVHRPMQAPPVALLSVPRTAWIELEPIVTTAPGYAVRALG